MKFRITGADRRTGRDVSREYEANTPDAAAAAANADGIMVASIELVSGAAAPQPLESLTYRSPTAPSRPQVPTYPGLNVAAVILLTYAIFCYALGLFALIFGGFALASAMTSNTVPLADAVGIGVVIGPGIALLFSAAVAHGLSAACDALRDIARNSWR